MPEKRRGRDVVIRFGKKPKKPKKPRPRRPDSIGGTWMPAHDIVIAFGVTAGDSQTRHPVAVAGTWAVQAADSQNAVAQTKTPAAVTGTWAAPAVTRTGGLHENEPADYTEHASNPHDVKEPSGWSITLGSTNITIQTDAAAPLSPSNIARFRYGAGDIPPGTSKTIAELQCDSFVYKKRAYVEFAIKFASNYRNHSSTTSKLWWLGADTGGGGDPFYFNARAFSINDPTGDFYLCGQLQHPNLSNRGLTHNLKGSNQVCNRNQWYHVECVLIMNTAGNADGEFHMWIDNDKHSEYTDVEWSDGAGYTWGKFRWTPLWGGQNDSIPEDFHIYVDHTYISKKD